MNEKIQHIESRLEHIRISKT